MAESGHRNSRRSPPPPGTGVSPPWGGGFPGVAGPSGCLRTGTPPTSNPPGRAGAPPFPSGPIRPFSGWERPRQTGLPFLLSVSLCPLPRPPPGRAPTHPRTPLPKVGSAEDRDGGGESRTPSRGQEAAGLSEWGPSRAGTAAHAAALKPSLCPGQWPSPSLEPFQPQRTPPNRQKACLLALPAFSSVN